MNGVQTYYVSPAIPDPLHFLEVLTHNLWWSWNPDAIELFRRISREVWKQAKHNPLVFLSRIPQERLNELTKDESFLAHLERVKKTFESSVLQPRENVSNRYKDNECIAYFCAEFGIHESVPLFAGGLGILAGDHLKAASNMGLPLIAVGLLYRQGYFRQYLNNDGWQQETYPENEIQHLPLEKVLDSKGEQLRIKLPVPAGEFQAIVWKIKVGRISLFLLDSNVPDNPPPLREVTAQLYGGDQHNRLLQEWLLGVGGIRALNAMGIEPTVYHMNEGHSAFINLERLAHMIADLKIDKKTALEIIPRTTVFTTHTSVPAGHDEFPVELITPFLQSFKETLHSTVDEIMSWGRPPNAAPNVAFSMTILAVRMAQYCNGVSRLHGSVARRTLAHLWPSRPDDEIPITHITNGVHSPSWLSPENALLFDRYLGIHWLQRPNDTAIAGQIEQIPDEELWRAHELSRSRMIRECRELMSRQLAARSASQTEIELAKSVMDPDILTIGFARRFATYKRAGLLLQDGQRLEAMLTSTDRPIQIIFSGKAHPHDNGGKELIRQIVHFSRRPSVHRRIIFLEDYDIDVARFLVQGVDVWLNTPRRPMEASGTSGMKAAVNGALHVSILDGWWDEAYKPDQGWSIGKGEEYQDSGYQDSVEGQALYNLLESDVIPCFYNRPDGQIPSQWIAKMKKSIKTAFMNFSSHRMGREYEERFYLPAMERSRQLLNNNANEARLLMKQHERLSQLWKHISIQKPQAQSDVNTLKVGDSFTVSTVVRLGELRPHEVSVQLYYGMLNSMNRIITGHNQMMTMAQSDGHGEYQFKCKVECRKTGRFGFAARVIPHGDEWAQCLPGFITWASPS